MIPDRLSWSVAWRSLLRSRRLTVLTLVVLSVSVVLVVFLTALIDGLERDLVEETTGAIPHLTVEPAERRPIALWERVGTGGNDGAGGVGQPPLYVGERTTLSSQKMTIARWRQWVKRAESFSPDIEGVSPSAEGRGFALRGETREAVRIYGVVPRRFDRIVPIQQNLVEGRFFRLGPGEVTIGLELAEELGVEVGDRVQIRSAEGNGRSVRVVGTFATGFGGVDQATVLMPLGDGQALFGLGSRVNSIGVEVRDVFEADRLARQLGREIPYRVKSWIEDNARLLRALEGQQRSSDLIVFFTALAASFAIASILIVLVTNKLPEIGILKAMGATRPQVRTVFALQGTILATAGAILGSGLGSGVVWLLSGLKGAPTASGRREPLFPFELSVELIVGTIVVAALLGFLASLVPALRAASVDPIEVIRGG